MSAGKTNNKALAFIFITVLIDVIGLGIIIPVVPTLIQELKACTLSEASYYGGWLTVTYAVMQFIFSPIIGGLSDRYGRRPVLLISLLGLGIDYICMSWAPTFIILFVGRAVSGICGASFTTATAYIADISSPEKRAQNFGLIGAAFGVGFIIGPVIGGIASQWGPRVPFLVAAAFSILNFLYGYFILPESLPKRLRRKFDWSRANPIGSLVQLQKYPIISGLIVTLILLYIAAHSVQSCWSYFTMLKFSWSEAEVGYSLGVVGVLIALVQGGLIRVVVPALGQKNSIYAGLILNTIGMLLFAFVPYGWLVMVALVPYCLGGIGGPALQGIISSQVPLNEQGELQGALTSLMSLTSVIGPLIMNNLFTYFTGPDAPIHFPGAPFVLGAAMVVVGILFAISSLRTFHRAQKSA
jgi:DHA1 family tetracycline resistance protein-like MFS transporter